MSALKRPVAASLAIGSETSLASSPSATVRYNKLISRIAAGSLACTATVSACFGAASSGIVVTTLIVGGRASLKHAFFLPGVPPGLGNSRGSGEAAQFSAISPEAVGQIRSRDEEYPSGLVGHGPWSLYFARSTRSPAAFCNSICPLPWFNGFFRGPMDGRC